MTDAGLIVDDSPVQRLLGFVVDVSQGDGSARCLLDVQQDHINRSGVVHGGIITTLLDCAGGITASLGVDETGMAPFLTVSLNVQFIASITSGRVTATGMRRGGGRNLQFVDVALESDEGLLLATAQGVFKRIPAPSKPKDPTR